MKASSWGSRHPLLFYRRTMDRIGGACLTLGIMLALIWVASEVGGISLIRASNSNWAFIGAGVAFLLAAFAYLSRLFAYVQAHRTYLSLVTPFLRLKISYRRIQSLHPMHMQQLYPKNEAKWAQRSFLEPFFGKTALVVEMRGYPMNPTLLRFFLPSQMFSPRSTGLVLLVPDWMKLSTELDSFHGAWLQNQSKMVKSPEKNNKYY